MDGILLSMVFYLIVLSKWHLVKENQYYAHKPPKFSFESAKYFDGRLLHRMAYVIWKKPRINTCNLWYDSIWAIDPARKPIYSIHSGGNRSEILVLYFLAGAWKDRHPCASTNTPRNFTLNSHLLLSSARTLQRLENGRGNISFDKYSQGTEIYRWSEGIPPDTPTAEDLADAFGRDALDRTSISNSWTFWWTIWSTPSQPRTSMLKFSRFFATIRSF